MVCQNCGRWVQPIAEKEAGRLACPECGHRELCRFLPLFVVTGPSGVGKTAIVPELRALLPEWEIFETDILWDSGGDWQMVRCNWLRIAHSIAQSGRPTILCGTILPEGITACEPERWFHAVHFLALVCNQETLVARLRSRPAWRDCTEAFIADQCALRTRLQDASETDGEPPIPVIDTTAESVSETARRICDWAQTHWPHAAVT